MNDNLSLPPEDNFLFYQTEDGTTRVRVVLDGGTVWLSQRLIAELYGTSVANINTHLRNLFEENELQQDSVIKEYLTTAADGKKYRTKHYNLSVILAVGYRVRSSRGTQFRRWATETLGEYLIKGFVLDDERLKAAEETFGQQPAAQTATSQIVQTPRGYSIAFPGTYESQAKALYSVDLAELNHDLTAACKRVFHKTKVMTSSFRGARVRNCHFFVLASGQSIRYTSTSKPVGPLSQGMLSYDGSFFSCGGKA